jgi:hypothetical protein
MSQTEMLIGLVLVTFGAALLVALWQLMRVRRGRHSSMTSRMENGFADQPTPRNRGT